MFFIYLFFFLPFSLIANPFLIDVPSKECLTEEDYIDIQKKLQSLDIGKHLDEWYPKTPLNKSLWPWSSSLATKEDFKNRISKASLQILINPAEGKFPIKELKKINQGGGNCIVCYISFNGKYEDLLKELSQKLEKVGFNGYLFYMIGGFPNPTGKEIQYSGVPYCFKIFTLLEAQKLGFHKVLWIDAAFLPLKDPTPLFDWISKTGCFFKMHEPFKKYILPKTQEYLEKTTGVDVLKSRYVSAQIIGFDLNTKLAQEFISEYYKLVELGWPFFSCFPEEYVFSSITGKNPEKWPAQPFKDLSFAEIKLGSRKSTAWVESQGYFFLQTLH